MLDPSGDAETDIDVKPPTFGSLDLSTFSFSPVKVTPGRLNPPVPETALRRSARKWTPSAKAAVKSKSPDVDADFLPVLPAPSRSASPLKRGRRPESMKVEAGLEGGSLSGASPSSSKKAKRTYATPETYAHLSALHDYLAHDLDVVFCGINPGYMSAEKGHHFANPTNHFWKCLHQSGLTPRLLPPALDHTLPEFSLGLTNLVERPSAEAAELSQKEMIASVPSLLAKIAEYRPRFVCFVGVGIWRTFERAIAKTAVHAAGDDLPAAPKGKGKAKGNKNLTGGIGLQPYVLAHNYDMKTSGNPARETLFFSMPSTSGRVVSHQLPDKVKLFAELKALVDADKQISTAIDISQMAHIAINTQC
ncbi:DNA glycosylase [Athelia psychrophila]|uniref:DNA glycosylase n=1 Tax=Athelia psychrophila TaxID=1759441 RepID=A0A166X1K5_9AGAM|nr:DNA glycosylase [Fibularhizoctonia sp. CBS 109695]